MLYRLALLCTLTFMLTACGGGGSAGSTPTTD